MKHLTARNAACAQSEQLPAPRRGIFEMTERKNAAELRFAPPSPLPQLTVAEKVCSPFLKAGAAGVIIKA